MQQQDFKQWKETGYTRPRALARARAATGIYAHTHPLATQPRRGRAKYARLWCARDNKKKRNRGEKGEKRENGEVQLSEASERASKRARGTVNRNYRDPRDDYILFTIIAHHKSPEYAPGLPPRLFLYCVARGDSIRARRLISFSLFFFPFLSVSPPFLPLNFSPATRRKIVTLPPRCHVARNSFSRGERDRGHYLPRGKPLSHPASRGDVKYDTMTRT